MSGLSARWALLAARTSSVAVTVGSAIEEVSGLGFGRVPARLRVLLVLLLALRLLPVLLLLLLLLLLATVVPPPPVAGSVTPAASVAGHVPAGHGPVIASAAATGCRCGRGSLPRCGR